MAARTRKVHLSQEWKDKIKAGVIMQRLMACVDGEVELTSTQVKAADILLKKVVPDLARSELTGEGGGPIKTEAAFSDDDKKILDHFIALKTEKQK